MNGKPTARACPAAPAVGLVAFLFGLQCSAGAAWLTESGGADMAMASAGRAAFATDSTTIAANPAGMLALNGSTVSVVAMPIGLDLRFHGEGETPGSAVNEQRTVPTMSAFAGRISPRRHLPRCRVSPSRSPLATDAAGVVATHGSKS